MPSAEQVQTLLNKIIERIMRLLTRTGHVIEEQETLQTVPSMDARQNPQRCANLQGFSLHAEARYVLNQRNQLEQLCRYINRPAIAHYRLKLNSAGDAMMQLKSPYKHGTTHIVMSSLEFIQHLAALCCDPGSTLSDSMAC